MIRTVFSAVALILCAAPLFAAGPDGEKNITVAKYSEQNPLYLQKPKAVLAVEEKYRYYDISGTTAADLRKQMKQNGTKWNDGKVYAALTTWEIQYRYDVAADEKGNYSIKSANTDISIVFTYPRVFPGYRLPDELATKWKSYMDSLVEHENGHRDLALQAATEINGALASLGTFTNRRDLDKEVKSLAREKLKRLKEVQVAYDAETHHGETQGALLN